MYNTSGPKLFLAARLNGSDRGAIMCCDRLSHARNQVFATTHPCAPAEHPMTSLTHNHAAGSKHMSIHTRAKDGLVQLALLLLLCCTSCCRLGSAQTTSASPSISPSVSATISSSPNSPSSTPTYLTAPSMSSCNVADGSSTLVAAFGFSTCAIDANFAAQCWGQQGRRATADAIAVTGGFEFTCVLGRTSHGVSCSGFSLEIDMAVATPSTVRAGVRSISAGPSHACAVLVNGTGVSSVYSNSNQ